MRIQPSNWGLLYAQRHVCEYRALIAGVELNDEYFMSAPVISKPLMDEPVIGRCTSGTLSLSIRTAEGVHIPKAASVVLQMRLSWNGLATPWIDLGHYYVSRRKTSGSVMDLECRDSMMKAGVSYKENTQYEEFPITMAQAVQEIASIMGVEIDSRTIIHGGSDYMVDAPDEGVQMVEILSMIAAAHGGNFIITEENKLRLIPFFAPQTSVETVDGFKEFTIISSEQNVTRITLNDNADNQFSAGNDDGYELAADCYYAVQSVVDAILASSSGKSTFIPYSLKSAYISPLVELGDYISVSYRNKNYLLRVMDATMRCSKANVVSDVSFNMNIDDEDEYPYTDVRKLEADRLVKTTKSYYGNRINRDVGFMSERMVDGEVKARMIANADTFTMQVLENGRWVDKIYFDPVSGEYKLVGTVTFEDLSTPGNTVITGDNITTGTIKAGKIQSRDGVTFVADLDNNTVTLNLSGNTQIDEIIKVIESNAKTAEDTSNSIAENVSANAELYQKLAEALNREISDRASEDQNYKAILDASIKATRDGLTTDISQVSTDFSSFVTTYHTYFTEAIDGLHISKNGSDFETILSDVKLSFTQKGHEVAYIQYNKLFISDARVSGGLEIENPRGTSYIRQDVDNNGVFRLKIMEV